MRLNALSTIFPHLDHERVHDFRWAFAAGLLSLTALYVGGLIVAALLLAAFLVPALYLLYLHEAQVYGREPVSVLITTVGGGAVLGLVVSILIDRAVGVVSLAPVTGVALLILLTVLTPLVQEMIKPLPAVVFRRRPMFAETMDGLTLGVAAGLGFALAQTLANFSPVFASLPFQVDPSVWIYPLVSLAVLLPILQGTCTGAFTAALWVHRRRNDLGVVNSGIPVAVAAHVAFALGGQLLAERGPGHIAVLLWQGVVVSVMILYTRVLLHRALLDEAAGLGFGEVVCTHCRQEVVAARFCPQCGMALTASPRRLDGSGGPRLTAPAGGA
ncbi:MAG: PrsW family glutamic-type intramembrane protease [Candidatus Dormibacteria bacterium]